MLAVGMGGPHLTNAREVGTNHDTGQPEGGHRRDNLKDDIAVTIGKHGQKLHRTQRFGRRETPLHSGKLQCL